MLDEKLCSKEYINKKFKIDLDKKFLILIQHPVTSEINSDGQITNTLNAVKKIDMNKLIIYPNNDAGSKKIIKVIKSSNFKIARTLNLQEYKTLLSKAALLIGNSSSGIHEAATFKVPVINIGTRQSGRLKPINVISTTYKTDNILKAIKYALNNKSFIKKIRFLKNPYGDGKTSKRIVRLLSKIDIDNSIIQKKITY